MLPGLSAPAEGDTLQRFEPPDGRVLHGLGQYVGYDYSDAENWTQVDEYIATIDSVPALYSTYMFVDPLLDSLAFSPDLIDMTTGHDHPYMMLIGLVLLDSATVFGGYPSITNIAQERILNGEFDLHIERLAERIRAAAIPCFVRPGFEFGNHNAGIHNDPDLSATEFVAIWRHIRAIFERTNVTNVAWVWSTVNPDDFTFMDYFPGDDQVDWFGINWFTPGQISASDAFLDSAAGHNRPVFVCEAAPIRNNGTANPDNWDNFFRPLFETIAATPHIKAFTYLHDPWDRGVFASWPDTRIHLDPTGTIPDNYRAEMGHARYLHMHEYLTSGLRGDDSGLPVSLLTFDVAVVSDGIRLNWSTASEIDNLGFHLYRSRDAGSAGGSPAARQRITVRLIPGGGTCNTTRNYAYVDGDAHPGNCYNYRLADVDYSGRETLHPGVSVSYPHAPAPVTSRPRVAPNPFNAATRFTVVLAEPSRVHLTLYSVLGEPVATPLRTTLDAGVHAIPWNGRRDGGRQLPSGVYLYVLTAGTQRFTGKLTLLR